MKLIFLIGLAFMAGINARAADQKENELARADAIEVWDSRVSDHSAKPVKIVDPKTIGALIDAMQESPAKWREGSFTSPSGYLKFVFQRGSATIAIIGLGDGFLVRGGGGDWESKRISKEIEAKIALFSH